MQAERWNPDKGWVRLLPKENRKSQIEEFLDLQSILGEGVRGILSELYGYFSLLEGIDIVVTSYSRRVLYIEEGLIYIDIEGSPYLLRMKDKNLYIPPSAKYIGVVVELYRQASYYDPTIAAPIAGQRGADRLKLRAKYVFDDPNSYPIAFIEEGLRIERIANSHNPWLPNPYIFSHLIEKRLSEEGSYIYRGLEVLVGIGGLRVEPGLALVEGRSITINYPQILPLPQELGIYELLLDNRGKIRLRGERVEVERDSYLVVDSHGEPVINLEGSQLITSGEKEEKRLSVEGRFSLSLGWLVRNLSGDRVIPSSYRHLSRKELELIEGEVKNQGIYLTEISTSMGYKGTLSGLHTDSMRDFESSDIYHPLFSCSLVDGGIGPSKKYRKLSYSIKNYQSLDLIEKEGKVRYLVNSYKKSPYLSQPSIDGYVELERGGITCDIYPNYFYLDSSHKDYFSRNRERVGLEPTQVYIRLRGLEVGVRYQIEINGVSVRVPSSLDLIAKEDSSIEVTFLLPQLVPAACYLLELKQGVRRVWSKELEVGERIYKSSVAMEPSLYQTFSVDREMAISDIGVGFRSIGRGIELVDPSYLVAGIGIAAMEGDRLGPFLTYKDIKKGDIELNKLIDIELDKPVVVGVGRYAICLSPYLRDMELLTSSRNVVEGELWMKEGQTWTRDISRDLSFYLTKADRRDSYSAVEIQLSALEEFSSIEYSLPSIEEVDIEIKKDGAWINIGMDKGVSTSKDIRLLLGKGEIDIGSSNWIGSITNSTSTWISKWKEFYQIYSSVDVELSYKCMEKTDYLKIYISSDKGDSWVPLKEQKKELIDANLSIYRCIWSVKDMDNFIEVKDAHANPSYIGRTGIVLRIDMFNGSSKEMYVRDMRVRVC
jgi:hypothetical protein